MLSSFRRCIPLAAIFLVATTVSARAGDEIQVYNAEIAKVGQWTFQLHSNYAFNGRKEPDFPGGLIPDRALNGTGEWAYGNTDWWEMGFYTPFAVDQNGTPYSNAGKIYALLQRRQDPAAVRHPQRGKAGVLLRRQFRVQLRHAAILRDQMEHGDPADHRHPEGR